MGIATLHRSYAGRDRLLCFVEPDIIEVSAVRRQAGGDVMNDLLSLAVSWLPFLVLIGVWLYLSRNFGMGARGSSGATMIELYEQQVEETRRMNAHLERIAVSLEKREGGAAG
jgi:hypothetical protein